MYIMIKIFNIYLLIKVLFILIALSLIVIIRAGYHGTSTGDRIMIETMSYFNRFAFDYIAIRLLSFGVLFAACFNLKAAMKKRLHLTKKRFILSIVLLLVSLINYYTLFWVQHWIELGSITYLQSADYLSLVVSALAGYLCCSSFKTE